MRLICPNCGAQYEVPDEVIPEAGRDVQCSDCGDTWYQYHPDFPPEPEAEAEAGPDWSESPPAPSQDDAFYEDEDAFEDYEDEPDEAPADDRVEPETPEPEMEPEPEPEGISADAQPTRRELDPSIRDVLREEAEREEQARQSDMGGGLETQQDLGIDEVDSESERRSREARARMARLRGLPDTGPEEEDDDGLDDIDPRSRRNLLPDIEEINSSLGPERVQEERMRAEEQRETIAEPTEPPEKSGFRSGFRIAILAAVVALIIYVFAPQIAEMVPALTEPLAGYVDLVNSGRLALAEIVENIAGSIGDEGI